MKELNRKGWFTSVYGNSDIGQMVQKYRFAFTSQDQLKNKKKIDVNQERNAMLVSILKLSNDSILYWEHSIIIYIIIKYYKIFCYFCEISSKIRRKTDRF